MKSYPMKKADVSIINWMNCIWITDLPPNAKYIACYLRKFMNDYHDMSWPSYSRIISETGLARSSVAKYLAMLESEGWIKRDKTIGKSTTYIAVLPAGIESGLVKLSEGMERLVRQSNHNEYNTSTPRELGSTTGELELVRHANTNNQYNKQAINNNADGFDDDAEGKKKTRKQRFTYDKERIKATWNAKAEEHGLPKINAISATVEKGLIRLYQAHVLQCKQLGETPNDIDDLINGYIQYGYEPTDWAKGANPTGKKYGITTALTQQKIDEILDAAR